FCTAPSSPPYSPFSSFRLLPPPSSTLFPYTTLFRSIAERMVSHYLGLALGFEVTTCPDTTLLAGYLADVRPELVFGVPRVWEKIDRKSTRLNSSHGSISYAVFCLKKKKNYKSVIHKSEIDVGVATVEEL